MCSHACVRGITHSETYHRVNRIAIRPSAPPNPVSVSHLGLIFQTISSHEATRPKFYTHFSFPLYTLHPLFNIHKIKKCTFHHNSTDILFNSLVCCKNGSSQKVILTSALLTEHQMIYNSASYYTLTYKYAPNEKNWQAFSDCFSFFLYFFHCLYRFLSFLYLLFLFILLSFLFSHCYCHDYHNTPAQLPNRSNQKRK